MKVSQWSPRGYTIYYERADGGISFQVERHSDGKIIATAQNDHRSLKLKLDKRVCKEPERTEITGHLNAHLAAYLENRI